MFSGGMKRKYNGLKCVESFQKQPTEVFCKKMFLETSQNSQGNICVRVSEA